MKKVKGRRQFLQETAAALAVPTVLPAGRLLSESSTGRIKIGQIGVGHSHAAGKLSAHRRSNEYEVIGVVEPNAELRRKAEKSDVYKDVKWMSQEELLDTPGLQAVAVETHVRDLLRTAQACVDRGLHIHLDKPAGTSLREFKKVLDTATARGRVVQMGYMYRYNPAVLFMREALEKGWLGEVFEVHTVMSKVIAPDSRRRLSEFRGGTMLELGCHIIDLLVGVLGKPQRVVPYHQHASSLDDTLEDNMLAVCTYPRAIATVKSAAMEVEGFSRRHFVVCGSEGTLHIQPLDRPDVRLSLSRQRGKYRKGIQDVPFGNYNRYIADAADLARIIRGKKKPDYTPEHDLATQETVLRASDMM